MSFWKPDNTLKEIKSMSNFFGVSKKIVAGIILLGVLFSAGCRNKFTKNGNDLLKKARQTQQELLLHEKQKTMNRKDLTPEEQKIANQIANEMKNLNDESQINSKKHKNNSAEKSFKEIEDIKNDTIGSVDKGYEW